MAASQRDRLSSDLMPRGENDGAISWNALRLGVRAIETANEVEVRSSAEIEAFMHDELVIMIPKPTDKNAPPKVPVGVNGETAWLPYGMKLRVPRMIAERLAMAQIASFSTDDNPDPRMDEGKVVNRTNGQLYPFQLIYDPSPHSAKWYERVMRLG